MSERSPKVTDIIDRVKKVGAESSIEKGNYGAGDIKTSQKQVAREVLATAASELSDLQTAADLFDKSTDRDANHGEAVDAGMKLDDLEAARPGITEKALDNLEYLQPIDRDTAGEDVQIEEPSDDDLTFARDIAEPVREQETAVQPEWMHDPEMRMMVKAWYEKQISETGASFRVYKERGGKQTIDQIKELTDKTLDKEANRKLIKRELEAGRKMDLIVMPEIENAEHLTPEQAVDIVSGNSNVLQRKLPYDDTPYIWNGVTQYGTSDIIGKDRQDPKVIITTRSVDAENKGNVEEQNKVAEAHDTDDISLSPDENTLRCLKIAIETEAENAGKSEQDKKQAVFDAIRQGENYYFASNARNFQGGVRDGDVLHSYLDSDGQWDVFSLRVDFEDNPGVRAVK